MCSDRTICAAYFAIICIAIGTYHHTIPEPSAVGGAVWVCIVVGCATPLLMMLVVATERGEQAARSDHKTGTVITCTNP